jgi:hypothetical protein
MNTTATPQQNPSRDVAHAVIAEALRQIGLPDEQLAQPDETGFKLEKEKNAPRHKQPRYAEPGRGSSRRRLVLRSLMGLLALACIGGVAAFGWQSTHGQAPPDPISTSSVSIRKKEAPAEPAPYNAEVAAKTDAGLPHPSSQAQTTPPRTPPVAPAPVDPDLAQSIKIMARELANAEQGIDQLKTGQAQMVHDNAELAEHLKATQEMARHNTDLIEDLKAEQAQIARDNVNFAEQLKASQEQMANIAEQLKGSQEQLAHLVASEQKQRLRTLASTRKPVPTPRAPQVQPQDPGHLQPNNQ